MQLQSYYIFCYVQNFLAIKYHEHSESALANKCLQTYLTTYLTYKTYLTIGLS